jgi:hypothetical protein
MLYVNSNCNLFFIIDKAIKQTRSHDQANDDTVLMNMHQWLQNGNFPQTAYFEDVEFVSESTQLIEEKKKDQVEY